MVKQIGNARSRWGYYMQKEYWQVIAFSKNAVAQQQPRYSLKVWLLLG